MPAATSKKPPYKIPSMKEILRVPKNGFRVVSTFSGCGGSCLGFRWAGFEHLWASEFVPAARETYAANFPGVHVDPRDIRTVSVEDVLRETGLKPGELDVLEGSPPCSSFSTAGKGAKGWGEVKKYSDVKQRTDDLFFEFIRLLKGLQPKVLVAENVSGLVKGAAKGTFLEIMAAFKEAGYNTQCRVLDAQWLGVPQQRERTIFVGVREDLGILPAHPSPLKYRYSIRDAIPWVDGVTHDTSGNRSKGLLNVARDVLPTVTVGVGGMNSGHFKVQGREARLTRSSGRDKGKLLSLDSPIPTVLASGSIGGDTVAGVSLRAPNSLEGTAIGRELKNLGPGQQSEKYFNLVRPHADRPSPTITQAGGTRGAASVVHPSESRKFTIPELRRLCGFPDDFELTGTYRQQWERLGRAVPPPMMYTVAATVRDEILRKL